MFLGQTIESVLSNARGDTEIIVALDGQWPVVPLAPHPQVTVLYWPESIGQRAATNRAARVSEAKYVMKLDAHCAVGPGFDVIMMADMQDDWTMVPRMYNLHAFDWVCQDCGERRYQGKSGPCTECGGETEREIIWRPKPSPDTTAMTFDRRLKFQYWSSYKSRQGDGNLVETMSLLGACWMLTRDKYFELNICDEGHGGWGQQGTEVACKTWLSGGRLVCNKSTWFSHMFRTQGGDFGFPYPMSGKETGAARTYSQRLWRADNPSEMPKWDGAIYPLQWLIDKFSPVPEWDEPAPAVPMEEFGEGLTISMAPEEAPSCEEAGLTKGILYYTDNRLDAKIMRTCQEHLKAIGLPVISVSLAPLDEFGYNIVIDAKRGNLTMFRQILAGLEAMDTDIVFFAEHDVVYHPSHFEFTPDAPDVFFYNQNVWKVHAKTGQALFHYSNHTSQLCAYRTLLLEHYRKRVAMVEEHGFSRKMGYEPGTHGRAERVDDYGHKTWMSDVPNLDIRHRRNLTKSRWSRDLFRNQKYTEGWTLADEVPGWGQTKGRMEELLWDAQAKSN